MKKKNLPLMSSFEGKFDIKPIKEEMDKIMEVDHECSKR